MAKLTEVVDSFLNEMGIDPRKCTNSAFPFCRFLKVENAEMVVIAREDPGLGRTLGFVGKLDDYTPKEPERYYRELLMLNFELIHGAFAIDRKTNKVVVIDNLQADHIDFDEFYASVRRVLEVASRYNMKVKEGYFD